MRFYATFIITMGICLLFMYPLSGQDLEAFLEEQMEPSTDYTTATFKSSRILNGHSIELAPEGQLDFRISHRFGPFNSGAYELFGLDQAHIHLGFEYGITDWLMVGFGRGTFEKTVDGFTKIGIARQSSGAVSFPVSVSIMSGMFVNGLRLDDPENRYQFGHRFSYAHQVFIARKFSQAFSLQLTPSYLHQNLVEGINDPNDLFALGAGSRLKLTNRISLNAEYFYLLKPESELLSTEFYHPFSLGIDIETGGHVFQIIFTNSIGMRENAFLGHTYGSWRKGDIHMGFNISRVFQIKK